MLKFNVTSLYGFQVYVHIGADTPSESEMLKIRSMSIYTEGTVWKKANFLGIGKPVVAEIFFQPPEKLFEVFFSLLLFQMPTFSPVVSLNFLKVID